MYEWSPGLQTVPCFSADALGMPLGPRKKLLKAVQDRRSDMEDPDILSDSRL